MAGGDILLSDEELVSKRVQELAISGDKPPLRYIVNDDDDNEPNNSPPLLSSIPVIDLRLLSSWMSSSFPKEEEEKEMENFRSALSSWGCFQAIGHEISSSILDELCKISRGFFELPMGEKQKYCKAAGGYQGYGSDQIVSDDQVLDWADRLYLVVYPENQKEIQFWPEKPIAFREVLEEYMEKTKSVLEFLLRAMAKSLNLEENCFLNHWGENAGLDARFNYYPQCSRPDLVFGVKSHSDGSGLTTILQDEVEGLQILKDGKWVTVPILPHVIFILVGDQMEIMSNGMYKGAIHRVVTNTKKARLSLAVFHSPEPDKEIEPVDGLIDEKRPRLYKMTKNYNAIQFPNFLVGKRTLDLFKV